MVEVLSAKEFYNRQAAYIDRVDPVWGEEDFRNQVNEESYRLRRALREAGERSVLDCTCGCGPQALHGMFTVLKPGPHRWHPYEVLARKP